MEKSVSVEASRSRLSASTAFLVHSLCGLALAVGWWLAHNVFSVNLISDPSQTIRLICAVECPIVVLVYGFFRKDPDNCSYLKAVARGLLALPFGALLNFLGAILLGAPVGFKFLPSSVNWSLLMSLLTFVPIATVYGSSSSDWLRIFAYTKPNGPLDYMLCLPAHGAIIGAWFGAWPMPLDWERPWQEWPICVAYGAVLGYLVAMVGSFITVLLLGGKKQTKAE